MSKGRISREAQYAFRDSVSVSVAAQFREELSEIENIHTRSQSSGALRLRSAYLPANRGQCAARSTRYRETIGRRRRRNSNAHSDDRRGKGLGCQSQSAARILRSTVIAGKALRGLPGRVSRDLS